MYMFSSEIGHKFKPININCPAECCLTHSLFHKWHHWGWSYDNTTVQLNPYQLRSVLATQNYILTLIKYEVTSSLLIRCISVLSMALLATWWVELS